ncbi:alpha/beta hydrolase family protein [Pseudomonas gingeri]|uniref:alpha/beta hydrolase family protein n=1 Tax=Pseudomonas gingeri TaxID=117681 RepID=UPI0015A1CA51|nr:alpha/beta hydrolase family protein [Pseudomonas gingeri]NVZ62323.1 alpha/beta hydrolase family protein [Pseudomonas gingeri]NVZ74383.1 alpha/beta hydrolase family protein [Pseudomonas gingeri]
MPPVYRSALPALCLSLILPLAAPVLAADPAPTAAPAPAEKPVERQPLPERSQEDATALERQLPQQEQQQLQAAGDNFLALWKPANTPSPTGAVIIIPGAGETADWPQAVGPLRRKLPDAQWSSLSLTLPDLQSEASLPRVVEAAKPAEPASTNSKDASTTAKPIEQAASAEADNPDPAVVENSEDPLKADAERIFARFDAAIAYAQQQNARSIVLLGHGTGAYWATRYMTEKASPQVQKLVLVAAQTPISAKPDLGQLTPGLKLPIADFFYQDNPLDRKAALQRLQASKRQKTSSYTQVSLKALPGNPGQEQLFRRIRGYLNPQDDSQ